MDHAVPDFLPRVVYVHYARVYFDRRRILRQDAIEVHRQGSDLVAEPQPDLVHRLQASLDHRTLREQGSASRTGRYDEWCRARACANFRNCREEPAARGGFETLDLLELFGAGTSPEGLAGGARQTSNGVERKQFSPWELAPTGQQQVRKCDAQFAVFSKILNWGG